MDNERNTPATKGDLQDLEVHVTGRVQELENRLLEAIHDGETQFLRAFYSVIESNQKRFSEIEAESAVLKGRLANLEDRILTLEKRLSLPPE
jgi:hypothetical protein